MATSKELSQRMKNIIKLLCSTALILTAVYGCQFREQDPGLQKAEKMYSVHFVSDEIETKTVFGEKDGDSYPTLWTDDDSKIAVSLNLNGMRGADVNPSQDYKSATFDTEFPQSEVTAPYVFYALSPFSAAVGATTNHGGYHFIISTDQTPLATSCDPAAQVLAASAEAASVGAFSNVQLHFDHLTAYGKLTLKNVTIPQGATIQSIELTPSVPFAGRFYYNFAEGTLEESSSSHTVALKPDNLTYSQSGSAQNIADIWFACAPCDMGGQTIKIDINLSVGVLSHTVSIPAGRLAFQAGHISKFGVDMSNAVLTQPVDRWVLVTDASKLRAGDQIIITNSATAGSGYALSTTQNNNNRGRTSVTIAKDTDNQMILQNPGNAVEVLNLVSGAYSGYFYLQEATTTQGRYLGTTSSTSSNYLRSSAPGTATNSTNIGYYNWKFFISNSVATITAYQSVSQSSWSWSGTTTTTYYKQIRYNSANNNGRLFSAYLSTTENTWSAASTNNNLVNVYVYRKEIGVNPDNDPILDHSEYGAYLSGGNKIYGTGDQLSREYMNDGTVTFAILTPSMAEVAEFINIPVDPIKGDEFTLIYGKTKGRNYTEANYNVTVVKVDGPKVWLSAGSGDGFIVKK